MQTRKTPIRFQLLSMTTKIAGSSSGYRVSEGSLVLDPQQQPHRETVATVHDMGLLPSASDSPLPGIRPRFRTGSVRGFHDRRAHRPIRGESPRERRIPRRAANSGRRPLHNLHGRAENARLDTLRTQSFVCEGCVGTLRDANSQLCPLSRKRFNGTLKVFD